eukprot:10570210-Alexandrium_andersonii.AAC.1
MAATLDGEVSRDFTNVESGSPHELLRARFTGVGKHPRGVYEVKYCKVKDYRERLNPPKGGKRTAEFDRIHSATGSTLKVYARQDRSTLWSLFENGRQVMSVNQEKYGSALALEVCKAVALLYAEDKLKLVDLKPERNKMLLERSKATIGMGSSRFRNACV